MPKATDKFCAFTVPFTVPFFIVSKITSCLSVSSVIVAVPFFVPFSWTVLERYLDGTWAVKLIFGCPFCHQSCLQNECINMKRWDSTTFIFQFITDTVNTLAKLLDILVCLEVLGNLRITREMCVTDILLRTNLLFEGKITKNNWNKCRYAQKQ